MIAVGRWMPLLFLLIFGPAMRAEAQHSGVNPGLLREAWPAYWIAHPSADPFRYGVYHFRKDVELAEVPEQFPVHVSADNRYQLYVNGRFVAEGPAQSDLRHWNFEMVDLAPHLRAGANTLAAVVWNGGEHRPMAQATHRTGFLLQGDTAAEQGANTDGAWRVTENRAYAPIAYRDNDPRLGWQYYVAGATDSVRGAAYPWGWEQPGYDDRSWAPAAELDRAAPQGVESHQKWQLVARPVPLLTYEETRFQAVRRVTGVEAADGFLRGGDPLVIPPYTKAAVLVDHGALTTGRPVLRVSGGAGSEVRLVYAEALYDSLGRKGNRREMDGKRVVGVYDVFLPDGGGGRAFSPLWLRTYQWVQLQIQTADAPLTLHDLHSVEVRYPAELAARFESGEPGLQEIWDAGWRTLRLSSQETFVSDLYWERMQYVGDTKVQALAWLYTTGDDRLMRQALIQFDQSRIPDGLTQSRYPADLEQFTPLYSLVWVTMVHDFWMHRPDSAFVRQFLPGMAQVLGWFERRLNAEGMLETQPWLDFVDSEFFERHEAIRNGPGSRSSAVHSLFYVYALEQAAEVFDFYGHREEGRHYSTLAQRVRGAVMQSSFNRDRGLVADTPDKQLYSVHASVMAALGFFASRNSAGVLRQMLSAPDVLPPQLYFRFYLGRALKRAGLGELYLDQLGPWRQMIADGMRTFGEMSGEPRSECHAWSASPSYEFLATVAGVEPASAGFRTVSIAPALGPLRSVDAVVPHHLGRIEVSLERVGADGLRASVVLPAGLTGEIAWGGDTFPLTGGRQEVLFHRLGIEETRP